MTLLRQFIVFGTDNAGIERSLRFAQALVSLIATYPALQLAAQLHLTSINVPPPASFLLLRSKINLTRRLLRFFRFLDQFKLGWDVYASGILDFDALLDVICKTSLGVFGMLETVTLLDLLEIDQLQIFGPEQTASLNYQAQYFWLTALCISLFRSATRLLRILGNQVAPGSSSTNEKEKDAQKERDDQDRNSSSTKDDNDSAPRKPNEIQVETSNRQTKPGEPVSPVILKLISDAMDLLLPASAVRLVQVDSEVIAVAMIISTAITANDVWVRCGRDMRRR
ncbi:peroxisomal biogenesis factor 11 [Trichoderma sp. SZMC 28013]